MSNAPYPGGCEEKYLEEEKRAMQESENDDEVEPTPSRTRFNAFVSFFRSREAIRAEVVMAAKNYMTQRMNIEQEELIHNCITLLSAKTMNDFVSHGLTIVRMLFPGEVEQFSDDVCNYWPMIHDVGFLPENTDFGTVLSWRLRKLCHVTRNNVTLNKCLMALLVMVPHSMQTERMISVYNKIVTPNRQSMHIDAVKSKMLIALNGIGTAKYDPREAVGEFLKRKDRRQREPDCDLYKKREYVAKFFR